jgi:hypothetical protein
MLERRWSLLIAVLFGSRAPASAQKRASMHTRQRAAAPLRRAAHCFLGLQVAGFAENLSKAHNSLIIMGPYHKKNSLLLKFRLIFQKKHGCHEIKCEIHNYEYELFTFSLFSIVSDS